MNIPYNAHNCKRWQQCSIGEHWYHVIPIVNACDIARSELSLACFPDFGQINLQRKCVGISESSWFV